MREVRNHEPPPIAWRLPLRLPNSESLDHLPIVPHLHCDVRVASMHHRETAQLLQWAGNPGSHCTAQP